MLWKVSSPVRLHGEAMEACPVSSGRHPCTSLCTLINELRGYLLRVPSVILVRHGIWGDLHESLSLDFSLRVLNTVSC
jgi:hypothetical protein